MRAGEPVSSKVRGLYASIGCWYLCGRLNAMMEPECWDALAERLIDRTDRPRNKSDRRPSYANRTRRLTRELLRQTFLCNLQNRADVRKIDQ